MELKVNNPNLSVILPVGCNAKCEFCYWEKKTGLTLERFQEICDTLPEIFKQVSITGGETTLESNLIEYLKIARDRFDKVVLNTNGYELKQEHFKYIDYVNISRHHWMDKENEKVFQTTSIPDHTELQKLCTYGDITLNCVLSDTFSDYEFVNQYTKFAKVVGAKVSFRKYFSNLNILTEVDKNDTLNWEHSCPACLNRNHTINGIDTTFKYSVQETCEATDGIYELILQSNGDLTIDWKGEQKLHYTKE